LSLASNPPIYHIIELVQMATGETPARLIKRTAKKLFWGVMNNQILKFNGKRNFKIPPIDVDPSEWGF